MRQRIPLTVAALMLLVPATLLADPPARPSQIQEWVQELDHDRFTVRDTATRNLIKAGKDAIPAVAVAAAGNSLEATDRAIRILKEFAASTDTDTARAARTALEALTTSKNKHAADKARAILLAEKHRILGELQQTGASVRIVEDRVTYVDLDEVKDLRAALPLLKHFPDIEEISLSNEAMTDAEMPLLKGLPKLSHLNLYRSRIGDEALKCFKDMPGLRSIPMGETRVTDAGLVHLKDLTHLEYVGLRGNQVTDAGLVHLEKLTNLTGLYLGQTKVTDSGLVHLKGMKKMAYLRLHTMQLTDAGLEHLQGLTSLEQVDLGQTQVTEEGVARLQKALPRVRVERQRLPGH